MQVTARRGGRGRGGGASRGRGARGSGGAGEAANEEDSRPRARHRDAERDLAKIHALRNRRTVVTECVGSPDSTHSLTLDCVVLRGVGWVCCRTNTLCLCLCLCQCLSLSLSLSLPLRCNRCSPGPVVDCIQANDLRHLLKEFGISLQRSSDFQSELGEPEPLCVMCDVCVCVRACVDL